MSDDEDAMMLARTTTDGDAEKDAKATQSSTSDDDDSSSSSSGSSSSSDSSDSESDGEGESHSTQQAHAGDRKYSTESVASSNGFARTERSTAEPLTDVNSNRAAARFREQNSEVGLMALGTKKRDRRTIEEIQRDLQKKRSRAGSSGLLGASSSSKPFTAAGGAARASPPKGSPVLSPEPSGSADASQLAVGLPQIKMPKGKPNSARSRLTMKLLGRGRPNPVPAPKPAVVKKTAPTASTSTGALSGSMGIVTNISAGAKAAKSSTSSVSSNDLDSYVAEQRAAGDPPPRQLEPRLEPKVIDWRPDGKVVRSILRSMLRFGDLTDVHIVTSQREAYADEHRLPNFVVRSNLPATTKVPEERLVKTALEIAERVQRAIEDKQDTTKYADVEIRPSQVIERLYENLKLRVAVQRALRDARYTKNDDKGAYVLVAKQADLPTLGIPRDFPPWFWAEKEHDWTSKKDTALLLGIYVHGFGAWEDILNDDLLHFHSQRALKGERMKKRAENLLKRLPPPDESAGEPRIVLLANALVAASSQTPAQSLGAVFNAIINNSSSSGATVVANPNSVGSTGALANKGRLHRAAERFAARQSSSSSSASASAQQQRAVPEDSIRRTHTQSSGLGDRHRKPSITSPAMAPPAATTSSYSDNEPEDGEVDVAPAPSSSPTNSHSSSSSSKRPLPSSAPTSSSSSSHSKPATKRRSASIERSSSSSSKRSASPRKRSKSSAERASSSSSSSSHKSKSKSKSTSSSTAAAAAPAPQIPKARVVLSPDACVDKWKPSKRLKAIRQVLKKMKIMETWSTNQKDEVVVEKVYKYVTTIGDAIDAIVMQAERDGDSHEWDELCSCLWAYAAGYTPFSSVTFERLYDDICADGDALRLAAVDTSRRPSAAST